jgi:hypothetical protein
MSDGLTADPLQRIWERVEDGLDIEDEFGGLKALKKQRRFPRSLLRRGRPRDEPCRCYGN